MNLGVSTSQRNESFHVAVKADPHKNLPISQAIQVILDLTRVFARQCDADINQQRRTTPRRLDLPAFSVVKSKLTHYALELSSRE